MLKKGPRQPLHNFVKFFTRLFSFLFDAPPLQIARRLPLDLLRFRG
ncbi:hypothetical protein SELSPUOL_01940 [Selenomonas sputigena ATCC 35185]|uniref:Uncharacterized protein n=1 Tax=Selenomonas sputigena (strain ATCC 35185 / DSM 20758 / CCUG 44933 / VPI D19B-28) TaxID=546271 RepID=C9LWT5_SELS3|nr:hypothetical protein SELSPUOL_01940 [Selenomonas sputigena ATCC 35185]